MGFRTWKRRQRGAQALEFALVLPVLLALLTGVVDYGYYFFQQHSVVASVRDGARYASTLNCNDYTVGEIETLAEARLSSALDGAGIEHVDTEIDAAMSIDLAMSTALGENVIVMTVSATITTDSLIGLLPGPGSMASTLVMRMEDQNCEP